MLGNIIFEKKHHNSLTYAGTCGTGHALESYVVKSQFILRTSAKSFNSLQKILEIGRAHV